MDAAITISFRVTDIRAFVRAAQDRAIADGLCATRKEARIEHDLRPTHLSGCAIMLFDPGISPPGTEILDSSVESGDY